MHPLDLHLVSEVKSLDHNDAYAEFLNKKGAGVYLPLKSMQVRNGEIPSLGGLLHCQLYQLYLAAISA